MNFLKNKGGDYPNYWCTWASQNMQVQFEQIHPDLLNLDGGNAAYLPRQNMNSKVLFEEPGWAVKYLNNIKKELYFMADDGWDVPYKAHASKDRHIFGSMVVNEKRFPEFDGTPEQRLKKLNEKMIACGWKGIGIWIAANACGEKEDELFDNAKIEEYYRERARWCKYAGVRYWKVDWGFRQDDVKFREMMTRVAMEEYSELIVEHSTPMPPVNNHLSPEGRFAGWEDYLDRNCELLKTSDVIRTYDVLQHFAVPTTLDRAAELLKFGNQLKDSKCVLNIEDEPYIGASLGCLIGVMRSECYQYIKTPDDFAKAFQRNLEVYRAVKWQRIAPPFSVGAAKTFLSSEILSDRYEFQEGDTWWEDAIHKTLVQSAPAVIARGMTLPKVEPVKDRPFVTASRNPVTGAYSVATLPRTIDRKPILTKADVTMEMKDFRQPVGVFGEYKSLTLLCSDILSKSRVFLQDLSKDEAEDVTDRVVLAEGKLMIDGNLFNQVCMSDNQYDISYPGLMVIVN